MPGFPQHVHVDFSCFSITRVSSLLQRTRTNVRSKSISQFGYVHKCYFTMCLHLLVSRENDGSQSYAVLGVKMSLSTPPETSNTKISRCSTNGNSRQHH